MPERRSAVRTNRAPQAIGPYSQAIVAGGLVHCSGQIALDPETGEMQPGDVAAQTERVMRNLAAVLEAAGSSLDQVCKCTIYLADMDDFGAVNEVYGRFFEAGDRPARATVQVSRLPRDARVEIDCVALV